MNSSRLFSACVAGLACVLSALTLGGCGGGGGGGGSSSNDLSYVTDWTSRGVFGPTGASQRVTVKKLDGTIVDSMIMNAVPAQDTHAFSLGSGQYWIQSDLYEGTNASGNLTGSVKTQITAGTTTKVETAVGLTPTSLSLSPPSTNLEVGQSAQFGASFKAADGRFTFCKAADVTWSTLGSGFSVIGGTVTGTGTGTGSVRATAGGFTGSASVAVTPGTGDRGKWTIMIYLDAANDLYPYSIKNMNQMESIATNPDVRFVVQWKQTKREYPLSSFEGTRRYLVKHDTTNAIASQLVQQMDDGDPNTDDGVDMGSPETMANFIQWAKGKYPADHYALVIWNHGSGWGRDSQKRPTRSISYDAEFNTEMQAWELAQAIGTTGLDIVATDACLMQMLEVAYEIKDTTAYIAGSEELTPADGYPYQKVFANFVANPDAPIETLIQGFPEGMLSVPEYLTTEITQSVVRSNKLENVAAALDELALALIANKDAMTARVKLVRAQAERYDVSTEFRHYYDLVDVAQRLAAGDSPAAVKTAATDVITAVEACMAAEGHDSLSAGSHGLAIDFSSKDQLSEDERSNYAKLRLGARTHWDEWLAVAP